MERFACYEPECLTGEIYDPCAGGDINAMQGMAYPSALIEFGINPEQVFTLDIRKDSPADDTGDYLFTPLDSKPTLIITNPPFAIAREIIEKAYGEVAESGFVVMLLRLNFLGSKGRRDLWRRIMPKYIFVHPDRMSFTSDGKTDSIEYAHFCWQKGRETFEDSEGQTIRKTQSILEIL